MLIILSCLLISGGELVALGEAAEAACEDPWRIPGEMCGGIKTSENHRKTIGKPYENHRKNGENHWDCGKSQVPFCEKWCCYPSTYPHI